ncbi:Calcium/calmodulin-dependent protein kinase kinase 2 [Escovopsis weberi]|uniref:Calcium/calmodulin-dependent protein kinase kinase 2 n=1 Tax=Escovopsis weberi TaxID=150374 RepID=A0A0M8N3C1_ESCWE|nr:Calcium/calmodulin-dependent protein kinase kinase 2 [Escovopsis weberi]
MARRSMWAWAAATGTGSGSGSTTSLNHGFASPLRQHRRTPSAHRQVKETLNAHVEFTNDDPDGRTHHRINQYVIKEEIGRGSYGAVHRATDQFGNEFAIKEFSKTRLRRRAQSQAMRQGPVGPRRAPGRGGPLAPQLSGLQLGEQRDSLFFIREEVAIMKKLNHPNLAQLIEVLDDPDEDSLYMVMEMCHKGVVMKVGLDEQAPPHDAERCRFWFRDLILGIEYLHAQGVIHRDIKPDNLLLADDDALKVVDFGVSEMFEKPDKMRTAKSAGSPAFLPPELCGRHAEVSGTAADIWSMGVTLYCLKYGTIPFRGTGILEIYEAIKDRDVQLPDGEDPSFVDLMARLLDKNPDTRITMQELRQHPWVTKDNTDSLLSAEENCAHLIEPPNELELSHAFTKKMDHILCVMKAIHKMKSLLARKHARNKPAPTPGPSNSSSSSSSSAANLLAPSPLAPETAAAAAATAEEDEKARNREIAARFADQKRLMTATAGAKAARRQAPDAEASSSTTPEPRFLGIGIGINTGAGIGAEGGGGGAAAAEVVSDSPTAVDFNVYDRAYEEAITRTGRPSQAGRPVVYMNKMVKEKEYFRSLDNLVDGGASVPPTPPPPRQSPVP